MNPEEILLFGSFARGEGSEDSSFDLLIVAHTDLPFVERIKRVLEIIPENEIPVEPLVYTPQEIKEKLEETDAFVVSAMHEGVLIWSKKQEFDIARQLEGKKQESEFKDLAMEVE